MSQYWWQSRNIKWNKNFELAFFHGLWVHVNRLRLSLKWWQDMRACMYHVRFVCPWFFWNTWTDFTEIYLLLLSIITMVNQFFHVSIIKIYIDYMTLTAWWPMRGVSERYGNVHTYIFTQIKATIYITIAWTNRISMNNTQLTKTTVLIQGIVFRGFM